MTQPSEMIKSCLEPYGCFHTCIFFFFKRKTEPTVYLFIHLFYRLLSPPSFARNALCVISPFETLSVCILLTSPPETRRRMRHNCFSDIFFSFLNLLSLVRCKKNPHQTHCDGKSHLDVFSRQPFSSHALLYPH